jgi:hypothetical protein
MRKVTLRLYSLDVETLKQFYPETGYNHVVRALVHRHARQLEANAKQRLSQAELGEGNDREVA